MQHHPERIPMILVVEDDAAVRNSMKFSLEAERYRVRAYSKARDVLEAPDLGEIDCVVVDDRVGGHERARIGAADARTRDPSASHHDHHAPIA